MVYFYCNQCFYPFTGHACVAH